MAGWLRLTVIGLAVTSLGASHQTPNFIVEAPTHDIARQVAAAAEESRQDLAMLWFGKRLPRWSAPCHVTVVVGAKLGAGGSTKFRFDNGHVFGWRMRVQGSLERILDSVIPHEVNHTILACYFRRPVPRWADEGAASLMEHQSEQQHQIDLVNKLMHSGRRIPLRMLLNIAEYPRDMNQVMALYAEGYSLTEYLIELGGRKKFLQFIDDAHHRSWDKAIEAFYEYTSIERLEQDWSRWVVAGSPSLNGEPKQLLASRRSSKSGSRPERTNVIRSQTPEPVFTDAKPAKAPLAARTSQPSRTNVRAPMPSEITLANASSAGLGSVSHINRSESESPQRLVPLTLTPIRTASSSTAERRHTPTDFNMPDKFSVPTVSEQAAFGRRLRETHIRMQATRRKAASKTGWAEFPGRFR